jgi:putative transposase
MRYDFVERHRGRWPVRTMCRVLRFCTGGYYDRRGRPQSTRAAGHDALVEAVKAIHVETKARYGSSRIHAEPVARGNPCCVNTVARLMRSHGVAAKTRRKFRVTTDSNHGHPVDENVLDRRFEPEAPNQSWTADITYVATAEGWLYLAAVEDLHSRRIVGWSMGPRIDSRLVVDALEMALARRGARRPLGPGEPVRQRALPRAAGPPRDHLQHEPPGELLG